MTKQLGFREEDPFPVYVYEVVEVEEIEFSTLVEAGMAILEYLQRLQREHGFPIPQSDRPQGPVQRRLVETDDEPRP